jgi:hypothetical protein
VEVVEGRIEMGGVRNPVRLTGKLPVKISCKPSGIFDLIKLCSSFSKSFSRYGLGDYVENFKERNTLVSP